VALPGAIAVKSPAALIVPTDGLLLLQIMLDGESSTEMLPVCRTAENCCAWPTPRFTLCGIISSQAEVVLLFELFVVDFGGSLAMGAGTGADLVCGSGAGAGDGFACTGASD
jgi:hypothetical protein